MGICPKAALTTCHAVHHLIVYDLVLINKGDGYNKGDGIFIAPVTGVYAFHFSVCVIPGSGQLLNLHGMAMPLAPPSKNRQTPELEVNITAAAR